MQHRVAAAARRSSINRYGYHKQKDSSGTIIHDHHHDHITHPNSWFHSLNAPKSFSLTEGLTDDNASRKWLYWMGGTSHTLRVVISRVLLLLLVVSRIGPMAASVHRALKSAPEKPLVWDTTSSIWWEKEEDNKESVIAEVVVVVGKHSTPCSPFLSIHPAIIDPPPLSLLYLLWHDLMAVLSE